MGFTEAVKHVFENYANFNGRARRSEYWYFVLFNTLVSIVLNVLLSTMGGLSFDPEAGIVMGTGLTIISIITSVIGIALFIPGLAVSVRRLHDIGKSGWALLLGFIPFIGGIILLIFCLTDSEPGENMYGANPKGM